MSCKKGFKTCSEYTLSEINHLIDKVKYTMSDNSNEYIRGEYYDYKNNFSINTYITGAVYLNYLFSVKDSKLNGYRFNVCDCSFQHSIENIKNYINYCEDNEPILFIKNKNILDAFKLDVIRFKKWESSLLDNKPKVSFNHIIETIGCNAIYESTVNDETCELFFDILSEINSINFIEYNDVIDLKQECVVNINNITNIKECKIKYKELLSNYKCNISLEEYVSFISCGLTWSLIENIYKCNYKLENNIKNRCPDLIIDNKKHSLCNMSFKDKALQNLKNKIKEIKLYENS